ncbi:MAG: hypothetical protein NTX19_03860 [Gemmatimonadetes bacterium]|nr:hypothetical protein [Gemmatimonadota bacterium]
MGLLDRLKGEMKNAGDAVRDTLDEGKTRIEIFRVRQSADAAAQALGYALHRARRDGKDLDGATVERLDGTLAKHEAEATRLEAELTRNRGDVGAAPAAPSETAAVVAEPTK